MHGPPSSYAAQYGVPQYPNLPEITVLDTVAPTLGRLKRRRWRTIRGEALAKWERAGFTFRVKEDDPAKYPAYDPTIPDEYTRLTQPCVYGVARLMKTPQALEGKVEAFAVGSSLGSWAAYKMGARFWMAALFRKRYLLAHEFGHCLGLRDRYGLPNPADRTGVMASDSDPDDHDLQSLRDFWRL